MPFCPSCHREYRPGFTWCSDFDIELVESLSEENYEEPDHGELELVELPPAPKKNLQLAFWMIALGLLATWIGASDMPKGLAYRTLEARLCDVLILLSGVLLLAAGVAYFVITGYRRAASTVGAVAAGVFAMTLFVGVLSGAIPCSGPS